jgi:hypothetical protein
VSRENSLFDTGLKSGSLFDTLKKILPILTCKLDFFPNMTLPSSSSRFPFVSYLSGPKYPYSTGSTTIKHRRILSPVPFPRGARRGRPPSRRSPAQARGRTCGALRARPRPPSSELARALHKATHISPCRSSPLLGRALHEPAHTRT